jgi:hypothetical protein
MLAHVFKICPPLEGEKGEVYLTTPLIPRRRGTILKEGEVQKSGKRI